MYYVCIIYVLYNACIKFLYLCLYEYIDLFSCGFTGSTTHHITSCNGTDSKYNANDDEDNMNNWHQISLYIVSMFLYL
jgi:hypothetical protein